VPMIGEWVALPVLRCAGATSVTDPLAAQVLYPTADGCSNTATQYCDCPVTRPEPIETSPSPCSAASASSSTSTTSRSRHERTPRRVLLRAGRRRGRPPIRHGQARPSGTRSPTGARQARPPSPLALRPDPALLVPAAQHRRGPAATPHRSREPEIRPQAIFACPSKEVASFMNLLHGPLAQARQADLLREAQHARLVRLARQNRATTRMPVRRRCRQLFAGWALRRRGATRDPASQLGCQLFSLGGQLADESFSRSSPLHRTPR
jgi:hypothetical protein